jgi:hypothetical protein
VWRSRHNGASGRGIKRDGLARNENGVAPWIEHRSTEADTTGISVMRLGSLLLALAATTVLAQAEAPRALELAQALETVPMRPAVRMQPDSAIPLTLQKQLDDLLAAKRYTELAKALNQTPPDQRLAWTTSRLLAGKTAFLGYSLVRDLWGVAQTTDPKVKPLADTALGIMALYVFELILVDGAICEDVSAWGPQATRYMTTFRPVFEYLKTLPFEEKKKVIGAAVDHDHRTRFLRKGDDFLCRGGMDEFQASINQLGPGVTVGELAAKYGEKSKTGIGTDVRLPAAAAYEPKFLPFEKYAPKQHKLRMEMVGTLAELLK